MFAGKHFDQTDVPQGDSDRELKARLAAIDEIIAAVRPGIQRDGGDIALVSVSDDIVRVRLSGACVHCSLATQTLGNIRRLIAKRLSLPIRVLPAPMD